MSGKVKMRCARCHKPFKASSAKQTLCAECEARERKARAATKTLPVKPVAAPQVAKPKIVGPGANILVPGLVPPPPPPTAVPHDGRDVREAQASVGTRHPEQAQVQARPFPHPQPQHQAHAGPAAHGRPQPQQRGGQQRPKKEPAPVIALTPELRERIEVRYHELAQPVEFDGIRTRIAAELEVPKSLVKKAVLELRQRDQMPSWWELQGYRGSDDELARIRAAYAPHLPLPAVGVHKQIATDLELDAGSVYQAIRRIRAEMHLPQYNPPESHASEASEASAQGSGAEVAQDAGVAEPAPAAAAPGGDAPRQATTG
ncbi:MAG TPA: hypothetical protein VF116_17940 [Ktedonobacterales bacterium]